MLAIRRSLCPLCLPARRLFPLACRTPISLPTFATTTRRQGKPYNALPRPRNAVHADMRALRTGISDAEREEFVRAVRKEWGNYIPEGLLTQEEFAVYKRKYGRPIRILSEEELAEEETEEAEQEEFAARKVTLESADAVEIADEFPENMETAWPPDKALQRREDAEYELEEDEEFPEEEETEDNVGTTKMGGRDPRTHPLTAIGQFRTFPTTVIPPKGITIPTEMFLSEVSNVHLNAAARQILGTTLEHSPIIAGKRGRRSTKMPLDVLSTRMSDMDSDVFLTLVLPGYYVQTLSALTELRKRLGGDWVLGEGEEQGVNRILDAGSGGAGIFAWRDIVEAEQARRRDEASSNGDYRLSEYPESEKIPARAEVVTGSRSLRYRMSKFLENTTFLPRIPYYNPHPATAVNYEETWTTQPRKYYDLIIATNSVLSLPFEYQRKQHIDNLWSLLNPKGGILLLMEKGTPPGFEAIVDARSHILSTHIVSGDSTLQVPTYDSLDPQTPKQPGAIIAPCTNHHPCPMFVGGKDVARRDWCRFPQRYARPAYMQRVVKATSRNHEDLEYSYVAVRRGIDHRVQRAAQSIDPKEEEFKIDASPQESPYSLQQLRLHSFTFPRTILPSLKCRGHVILDVCTPAGTLERWTIPKSHSRAAYRDARKSRWGDLWALGAKTKIARKVKLKDQKYSKKAERERRRLEEGIVLNKPKGKKRNPGKNERQRRKEMLEARKLSGGVARGERGARNW